MDRRELMKYVGHNADLYIANQVDNTQNVQSFMQRQSMKLLDA